ncbi:MAG: hypothetical protein HKM98_04325 [Gammaproteobacteria bacterium]|nr:hypothetical protein [Gammaproteobacteria bacterium]
MLKTPTASSRKETGEKQGKTKTGKNWGQTTVFCKKTVVCPQFFFPSFFPVFFDLFPLFFGACSAPTEIKQYKTVA